jgi:DNA-binding NarL/FixJ family response regulator
VIGIWAFGSHQPPAGEKAEASMDRVRILLVDGSPEFLDSAAHFLSLEPRVEVVGRTRSQREAAELAARLRPDVVLVDLGLAGLAVARRVKDESPAARVLLLTVYDLVGYEAILDKGPADGVLAKDRFGADLLPLLDEWFPRLAQPGALPAPDRLGA